MPFKKGQSGNPKGQPKGAPLPGRPTDRFKELCRRAFEDAQGLKLMVDIAAGEDFPQVATNQGTVLPLPPELKERRSAVEWLADRGYGKAEQSIEVNDVSDKRPSREDIESALASLRGLAERVGVDKKE